MSVFLSDFTISASFTHEKEIYKEIKSYFFFQITSS